MPRKTETVEPIDLNDLAGLDPEVDAEPVEVEQENPALNAYTLEKIVTQLPTSLRQKSLIPELYRFARSLPPDHPYDQLSAAAISAGWIWKLTEITSHVAAPGFVMVHFDVKIGKATSDLELEYFDTITMMVPQEAPSPSLFARANAATTLIYMVFGRLPPMPQQAPAPQPVAEPAPAPVQQPEPQVPWQEEEDSPKELPNVVLRRTADGLPIIADLYSEAARPDDLITAAMNALADGLEGAGTQAALTALWNKNANAVEFIKDFGSDGDKTRLATMFKNRAKELRN
jgi:hypothetical protein